MSFEDDGPSLDDAGFGNVPRLEAMRMATQQAAMREADARNQLYIKTNVFANRRAEAQEVLNGFKIVVKGDLQVVVVLRWFCLCSSCAQLFWLSLVF